MTGIKKSIWGDISANKNAAKLKAKRLILV